MISTLANPMCIRLRVDFVGMPGALNALTVDHSDVTYSGKTNAQDTGANVGSSVSTTQLISGGSLAVGYTRPSTVSVEQVDKVAIDVSASTITFTDNTMTGVTDTFHPSTKIKVECRYVLNSVNTYRNLGIYTVSASTVPTATVITVDETIVANECSSAATVKVTSVSNVIVLGDHDITKTTTLSAGNRVKFGTNEVDTTVASTQYHGSVGYIIFAEENTDTLSADVASATMTLSHHGTGTMENVECSDRGLCGEDGTCKCFQGYTGDDCSVQKAIQM